MLRVVLATCVVASALRSNSGASFVLLKAVRLLVLEAAINGRADALVTYNVRDFVDAAPRFGVRIARPAELLLEAFR